jgi:hypothetical protein
MMEIQWMTLGVPAHLSRIGDPLVAKNKMLAIHGEGNIGK